VLTAATVLAAILLYFVFEYTAHRNWMGVPSGHFVAASALAWITTAMSLLAVVITSFLVASEFSMGTVKAAWVRPVARKPWYAAKIVTASGAVSGFFLLAAAFVLLFAVSRLGFSDLLEKDYVVHPVSSLNARLAVAVALTVWGLFAVCAAAGFVAGWVGHAGGAIATSIGFGIVFSLAGSFEAARPFLVTTCVSAPFEQMVAMTKGLPQPYDWNNLVLSTIVCGGAWMAATLTAGAQLIHKKDITQ
jgi:ABC-type transport system involved in multi-copper enzyme maturation permease subunit